MTAEVLTFPQKKKDIETRVKDFLQKKGWAYFCVKCNEDSFRIYADGTVHCVRCALQIKNLRVEMK